jgi:hypothetical protein
MPEPADISQITICMARILTNTPWSRVGKGDLDKTNTLPEPILGQNFEYFIRNGARCFSLDSLKVHTAVFNPADFLGQGWTFWKGPARGKGLKGKEDCDPSEMGPTTIVDFDHVNFEICLKKGETEVIGEEKFARLREHNCTIFGASVFMGLWLDYQKQVAQKERAGSVLEKIYVKKRVGYMDFPGRTLRNPNGQRHVLTLSRTPETGDWDYSAIWNGARWFKENPTGMLFSPVPQ